MSEPSARGTGTARTLSIVGAVLGALSILLLPIILGTIGAVLGFVAYSKGDKPLGLYVGIGSIVATIIGMILGAAVYQSMSS